MNEQELNRRCIDLFQNPDVRNHMWHPRMFWDVYGQDAPTTSELHDSKFDLMEPEVLFAGAAHVPSVCADDPEHREPGHPAFIRRMLDRGDTPLLHRPH
ncbi:MAG: hypothetical protein P8011_03365 [Acidihalobacter sp.]|uniref:hypothetical protein n=1 Tax=Acidihalobacter sp. TaxID=1872108 RepID=UPI00307E9F49